MTTGWCLESGTPKAVWGFHCLFTETNPHLGQEQLVWDRNDNKLKMQMAWCILVPYLLPFHYQRITERNYFTLSTTVGLNKLVRDMHLNSTKWHKNNTGSPRVLLKGTGEDSLWFASAQVGKQEDSREEEEGASLSEAWRLMYWDASEMKCTISSVERLWFSHI